MTSFLSPHLAASMVVLVLQHGVSDDISYKTVSDAYAVIWANLDQQERLQCVPVKSTVPQASEPSHGPALAPSVPWIY